MNSLSAAPRPSVASFWKHLRDFIFAQEVPYGMALVRMTLPLVLLVDVLRRWTLALELYSPYWSSARLPDGGSGIWPRRLGKILVGMFFLGAAVTTMNSTEFFSGDQSAY